MIKARCKLQNNSIHSIQPSKWKIEHGCVWALHAITLSSSFLREISSFIWLKGEMNEMFYISGSFCLCSSFFNTMAFKPLFSLPFFTFYYMLWTMKIYFHGILDKKCGFHAISAFIFVYPHLDYYFKYFDVVL